MSEITVYGTQYIIYRSDFHTGNPEQWRWFVPHDVPGLVSLFKSNSSFISHLSEFFEGSMKHPSNFLPNPYYWYFNNMLYMAMHGIFDQIRLYRAGNEPDLLAVYLFNYVARADLTQKVSCIRLLYLFMQRVYLSHTLAQYARWLVENKYTTEADGLPGNDDYGTEEKIDFVH